MEDTLPDFNQYVDPHGADDMLAATEQALAEGFARAREGISSLGFQLDETIVFMLDNHQEVHLRVRQIDIAQAGNTAMNLRVFCRTDFENVLILAKKLKMKISAFSTYFTVVLSATADFLRDRNQAVLELDQPAKFFETLDELKRPIFLNLNHYIIERISD